MRITLSLALLVLAGCSGAGTGVRYDAGQNMTMFESRAIDIGKPIGDASLGSARITMRAEASCAGEECVPGTYEVSLSKAGGNDASSDYASVSFETDDGTVSFKSGASSGSQAQFFSTNQGEFVRLSVPFDIFESFATSPTLTVRLGGSSYVVNYDRRSGFRKLLPEQQG